MLSIGLHVIDVETQLLHSLQRLDAARVSVAGFRQFFDRMKGKTDSVPPWLSNHPSSAERAAALGAEVGAVARTPALSPEDWATLRAGCTTTQKK